jgi:hypothetical protein
MGRDVGLDFVHSFDVAEILRPAGCALVANELGAADEVHVDLAKWPAQATRPGFFEGQTGQFGEDVDAPGHHTDLVVTSGALKSSARRSGNGAPNAASARMTLGAFSDVGSTQTSRSPVARGRLCCAGA